MKYLNELTKSKIFNYKEFITIVGDNILARNTLQNYKKNNLKWIFKQSILVIFI